MSDNGAHCAHHMVKYAAKWARLSPCAKSKRGVVVWDQEGLVVSGACNAQPKPFMCDGSAKCRANCGELCVHAETAALQKIPDPSRTGMHMLHVKVVDGQPVASGDPSCVRCSAQILAHPSIVAMWLFREGGLYRYSPYMFHALSLRSKDLTFANPDVDCPRQRVG